MKTSSHLYDKFVNEEHLKRIRYSYVRRKFFSYFIFIPLLLAISVFIVTYRGYNFNYTASVVAFIFAYIILLIVIKCVASFVILDFEYDVFKKHYYLILFLLGYLVINVVFYILPIITVDYKFDETGIVDGVVPNVLFYFLIYIPLMFAYSALCYYAYAQCFAKYRKGTIFDWNENNDQTIYNESRLWLYHRFINEESLKDKGYIQNQKEIYSCCVWIYWFSFFSVLCVYISGYNFDDYMPILWFCCSLVCLICALISTIRFIFFDRKLNIFKKHWYLYVFISINFILAIAFYVLAYFNITIGSNNTNANWIFFWFLYCPTFLAYNGFCNRAFKNIFKKYPAFETYFYKNEGKNNKIDKDDAIDVYDFVEKNEAEDETSYSKED